MKQCALYVPFDHGIFLGTAKMQWNDNCNWYSKVLGIFNDCHVFTEAPMRLKRAKRTTSVCIIWSWELTRHKPNRKCCALATVAHRFYKSTKDAEKSETNRLELAPPLWIWSQFSIITRSKTAWPSRESACFPPRQGPSNSHHRLE